MPATVASESNDFLAARKRVRSCAGRALFRLRALPHSPRWDTRSKSSAWLLVLFLLADKLFSLRALGLNVWTIWGGVSALLLPYVLWRALLAAVYRTPRSRYPRPTTAWACTRASARPWRWARPTAPRRSVRRSCANASTACRA